MVAAGGMLFAGLNPQALEKSRVFCQSLSFRCLGRGALVAALVQSLGNEGDALALRAPVVDHHVPVARKANLQDLLRSLAAAAFQEEGAVTHDLLIARWRPCIQV